MFSCVNNIEPPATENEQNKEKPKSKPAATVSNTEDINENPLEIIENDENQPGFVLNRCESPPPTQIVTLPKSLEHQH